MPVMLGSIHIFDRSPFGYVNPFDAAKLLPCFEDGVANYRRVTA